MTALIVIIVLAVIIAAYFISTYNRLVKLRNRSEESYSQIDAHLKMRFDLIPNLVETVKGYAKHESQTLENVIAARNSAMNASSREEMTKQDNILSGTLKSLFALQESYPELKANTNFMDLQQQLQKIETELLNARKYYNAIIGKINTSVETFPSNLVAKMTGFRKLAYLQIEEEAKARVEVKF